MGGKWRLGSANPLSTQGLRFSAKKKELVEALHNGVGVMTRCYLKKGVVLFSSATYPC